MGAPQPSRPSLASDNAGFDKRGVDMLVKTSGVGVYDQTLEAAVLDIKEPHTITVFWDVDAPATLDRVKANAADPFADLIPAYDLILTYGGGDPVVRAYKALGARTCVPVYNALDPDTHHPVAAKVPPDGNSKNLS